MLDFSKKWLSALFLAILVSALSTSAVSFAEEDVNPAEREATTNLNRESKEKVNGEAKAPPPPACDLVVKKGHSPFTFTYSGNGNYYIKGKNLGSGSCINVRVVDHLPPGMTFAGAFPPLPAPWSCNPLAWGMNILDCTYWGATPTGFSFASGPINVNIPSPALASGMHGCSYWIGDIAVNCVEAYSLNESDYSNNTAYDETTVHP